MSSSASGPNSAIRSHAVPLLRHAVTTLADGGDGNCTPICTLLSERGVPFVFYSGYDDARQNWPEAALAVAVVQSLLLAGYFRYFCTLLMAFEAERRA